METKRKPRQPAEWEVGTSLLPGRLLLLRPGGSQWHSANSDECDCIAASFGRVCSHRRFASELLPLLELIRPDNSTHLHTTNTPHGQMPERTEDDMNITNAFPSKYLKAETDLADEDLLLTIEDVQMETVGQGADADEKPVLYFTDCDKGLVLNKTNSNTIAGLYGPDTDEWRGKKVKLFAQEVDFQGRQVLAIRVRLRKPQGAAGAPPARQTAAAGRPTPTPDVDDRDPFADE